MIIINNMIKAATVVKSKQAATKLNAMFQAQTLLDDIGNSSSDEEQMQKRLVLEAFTSAIMETL